MEYIHERNTQAVGKHPSSSQGRNAVLREETKWYKREITDRSNWSHTFSDSVAFPGGTPHDTHSSGGLTY